MVSSVLTFEGGKSSSNSSVDNKHLLKSTSTTASAAAAHLTSSSSVYNNNNDSTTGTTPSLILNDHISLLFPKCRPRNDVILNNNNSSNNNNHSHKNLSSDTEITSSVISETTQSSVYSKIVHNHTNNSNNSNNSNNNNNQQSPPTSSLSSSETSSSTKSPNIIGTNPFLSNLSTNQHYDSSAHSTIGISNQMGDIKRIMNNENENSASHNKLAGLQQQSNLTLKNMSNQIDGMSKYSHKRIGIQNNKQNYHQSQQQQQQQQQQPSQQQQQTHNYYQYNQNPFIKDSERCVWELRNRNTPLNNSSSVGGGGGGCGGTGAGNIGIPSSNNPTTPSSTVLNSPDLIEMETKLNFSKQHHSTIKVGRSPVNNHHYTILDHHSNNVDSTQQSTINIPSSQTSHHVVNGGGGGGGGGGSGNNSIINNSVINSNSVGAISNSSNVIVGGIGGKSLNVISDGEVVVFDDIGDNYSSNTNNSANNSGSKLIRSDSIINNEYNNLDKKSSIATTTSPTTLVASPGINTLYSSPSAAKLAAHHQTPDIYNCSMDTVNTNSNKKLEYGDMRNSSGIMEYDGSPRKFGQTQQIDISMYTTNIRNPQQSSSTLFPPRPGFPQRILNNTSPANQLAHQNYQQQHQQQAHQMQPSPHQIPIQSSPSEMHNMQQQNTTYNNQCNTDDTSNDVSEICNSSEFTLSENNKKSTFDYLYEFSETRKVLEEFFKCPSQDDDKTLEKFSDFNGSDVDSLDIHYEFRDQHHLQLDKFGGDNGESYIGQRLAKSPEVNNYQESLHSPKKNGYLSHINSNLNNNNNNNNNGNNLPTDCRDLTDFDLFLDSASRSSGEIGDNDDILKNNGSRRHSKCFRYSPETTDYDSNCGDLDSEVSLRLIGSEFGLSGEFNNASTYSTVCTKFYTSMPVLEDGLSSGHASDTENNNNNNNNQSVSIMLENNCDVDIMERPDSSINKEIDSFYKLESPLKRTPIITPVDDRPKEMNDNMLQNNNSSCKNIFKNTDPDLESLYSIRKIDMVQLTPPPPAPAPHRKTPIGLETSTPDIQAALQDIRSTLQRTKTFPTTQQTTPSNEKLQIIPDSVKSPMSTSPIWVPRLRENSDSLESIEQHPMKNLSGDEDEADTDLETDRLLGHQRLDDMGFYDEKTSWCDRKPRSLLTSSISKLSPKIPIKNNGANAGSSNTTNLNNGTSGGGGGGGANGGGSTLRQGLNSLLPTTPEISISSLNSNAGGISNVKNSNNTLVDLRNSTALSTPEHHGGGGGVSGVGGSGGGDTTPNKIHSPTSNLDDSPHGSTSSHNGGGSGGEIKKKTKSKEVLIEGVLFRARYLGSTQLVCEGQPTKSTRMIQAEEAVSRIKSPDGETQPSTEVDLFISTEKIMVLNTDLKEIMMDHALRTISYIADIGDLVVLMARRRFVPSEMDDTGAKPNRTPKMICHVFESEEAQFIAQSIGQAFQVAYMEFLKANGIEDHSFVKEMDYQEVLNSQEIFGDELEIFAKKELQKEVVVPKAKGEILGVVIVESGWGSMLPTVVIANLLSSGAAARCGQLNIGDQIIAINGLSLVGLPLSTCQTYIKNTKNQTVVKFTVVPCAPVVEVKIKRPNTKYQLGFSVQNGVICSLLRGGIAERGGVRVGHRIIEINNQSVVAVPHEKIVNLLATSVGEILMKTMPTSMFRLLTGQENPIYI